MVKSFLEGLVNIPSLHTPPRVKLTYPSLHTLRSVCETCLGNHASESCGLHTLLSVVVYIPYEGMHSYFDLACLLKPCCLAFSLLSCFLLLLGGCLVHQRLSSLQRLSSFSWRERKGAEMDAPSKCIGSLHTVYIRFTYPKRDFGTQGSFQTFWAF